MHTTGHLNQLSSQPIWKCFHPCLILKSQVFSNLAVLGEVHCFVEYRSGFPQQLLWPLESWPTASSVYRQQRGYCREGLFFTKVRADSSILHGARRTDEGDSRGVVLSCVLIPKQCPSRMLEAMWGTRCKSPLFNAPLLCLVFACLLYCVFDEVLVIIYCIFNAACQILWM